MSNNYNNRDFKNQNNNFGSYNLNNKVYNHFNTPNVIEHNKNNDYISPLKRSYDFSIMQNKFNFFQNENLTINKVSPSHILYKPLAYDDGGYSNNYYEVNKNNYQEKNLRTEPNINPLYKRDINQRNPNLGNMENNDKYSNIYGFKKNDEKRYKHYLKNPYYKGHDTDDGYKHYNPDENNFKGSSYGGYIYNYYLNAPMRSDKTENWRFPPLYYFRPKYK